MQLLRALGSPSTLLTAGQRRISRNSGSGFALSLHNSKISLPRIIDQDDRPQLRFRLESNTHRRGILLTARHDCRTRAAVIMPDNARRKVATSSESALSQFSKFEPREVIQLLPNFCQSAACILTGDCFIGEA